jgi:hypothetical protein
MGWHGWMKAAGAFNGGRESYATTSSRYKAVSQELNDNGVKRCPGRREEKAIRAWEQ